MIRVLLLLLLDLFLNFAILCSSENIWRNILAFDQTWWLQWLINSYGKATVSFNLLIILIVNYSNLALILFLVVLFLLFINFIEFIVLELLSIDYDICSLLILVFRFVFIHRWFIFVLIKLLVNLYLGLILLSNLFQLLFLLSYQLQLLLLGLCLSNSFIYSIIIYLFVGSNWVISLIVPLLLFLKQGVGMEADDRHLSLSLLFLLLQHENLSRWKNCLLFVSHVLSIDNVTILLNQMILFSKISCSR